MEIKSFQDGVNELRLFDPCPVCGQQVTSFELNYDMPPAGFPGWDLSWRLSGQPSMKFSPCAHTAFGIENYTMYAYPVTSEGKKAFNVQSLKLASVSGKNPEAGNSGSVHLRGCSYRGGGSSGYRAESPDDQHGYA